MRYYIVFFQESTVFGTDYTPIANKYKNKEYCMVIDTKVNKSYMFEDSVEDIEKLEK